MSGAAARAAAAVGESEIAAFARDGAVALRGLFSAAEIARLADGIEACRAAPGAAAKIASGPDDPGVFFEDFRVRERVPALDAFLCRSPAAAPAGLVMGAAEARLFHDHVLVKTAGARQPTPWHQDLPYYNIDADRAVSLWIPVDPVDRATTLEFVAGSHLGPWRTPRAFRDRAARWFPEGALAEVPDIEADRAAFPILGWALEPGDCVAFSMLVLHAAGGAAGLRRVYSARFVGEGARHAPRPWTPSPAFPELDGVLPAGAPLDHPLFPTLWRRAPA